MKITVFKKEEYRNCPIYYRKLKSHFEYLTIVENQIYTAHCEIKPTILNKIFYLLKIEPMEYSQQQQSKILSYLRKMAETTIDFILDKKQIPLNK